MIHGGAGLPAHRSRFNLCVGSRRIATASRDAAKLLVRHGRGQSAR